MGGWMRQTKPVQREEGQTNKGRPVWTPPHTCTSGCYSLEEGLNAGTGKQADNELSDKNVFQISNYGASREVPQSC